MNSKLSTGSSVFIRKEQPQDYREVENLTRESFWNVYRPGCTEHFVLNQYRNNPDFIHELDFVMEVDGRIIGHVMFSKAELTAPLSNQRRIGGEATFGPISIHPNYQRKGYGLQLLQYALKKARELGIGFICMEGNIEFYKHAGFGLASQLDIHYHSEPKDAEVTYFLAQELEPGWLQKNGISEATYCPPKGYFVADDHPEAFEAYEATFPKKEKAFQEGQLPQFCQSCGMKLGNMKDCGTNADGSTCFEYCRYCYKDGHFIQEFTMEEMIDHCTQFIEEMNKLMPKPMTVNEYREMANQYFPMLKRWRKQ